MEGSMTTFSQFTAYTSVNLLSLDNITNHLASEHCIIFFSTEHLLLLFQHICKNIIISPIGPSNLRALHGTKCPLLTVFFSLLLSFSLLLWLLFSQKGLS